jgi:hypothetical protein
MDYILRLTTGEDLPLKTAERLEIRSRELGVTPEALIARLILEGLGGQDCECPNGIAQHCDDAA